MLIALTRDVSPAMARCELTHLSRQAIDLNRARLQHAAYEERLREAGCRVERLMAGAEMPDGVFIEDTAVVVDETAIVTRPGARSRRVETREVARALGRYRRLRAIEAPGTLDGGDVLVVGRQVFVGRSSRTNQDGIAQLRRALTPYAYETIEVEVRGCLHLKSAVTTIGDGVLLVNPAWLPREVFARFERVDVHRDEPAAANACLVAGRVVYPSSFPKTLERLQQRGLQVLTVEASEVAKAEGAVTCCSLIFPVEGGRPSLTES